ncbi:MAG: hypothetical protein Tsb0013_25130 [Phycisphaerales bacterium]
MLAVIVATVHTVLRVWVIFGPGMGGPSAADEVRFHLPVIERFSTAWPAVDLSDYPAAATPGHHLALALLDHIASPSIEVMRLISGVPITLLLALLVWWCAQRVGALAACALALPLACSPHTFAFSALVLPESTSWCLVGAVLILACSRGFGIKAACVGGLLLLASAGVRQLTLWCAAPLWTAAWLSGAPLRTHATRVLPERLFPIDAPRARGVRTGLAVACTLPAFALIAWFVRLWGGLVPPTFQSREAADAVAGGVVNQGFSPSAPAFMLCILGAAGVAFAPTLLRPGLDRLRTVVRWALVGGAFGLIVSLIPATSYDMDAGRWSGLWNVANRLPTLADRSLFITGGAVLGGMVCGACVITMPVTRVRWVLLAALTASMAAHITGAQMFQRYIEPLLLIILPLAVAGAYEEREDAPPRWSLLGPVALAGALLVLTIGRVGGTAPVS